MLILQKLIYMLGLSALGYMLFYADIAQGQIVRSYYEVREYRNSTRWTLTEWLRIKERMRLMDVWLAMFSRPKEDRFRPEVNLAYGTMKGGLLVQDSTIPQSYSSDAQQVKAQVFLTNLITASTGVRTLNVDIGFGGVQRKGSLQPVSFVPGASQESGFSPGHQSYGFNLRVFGKHIQDSSLVLNYGHYNHSSVYTSEQSQGVLHGVTAGASLNLYMSHWLGLEGHYQKYGDTKGISSDSIQGVYSEYSAFIEISLLRFMAGAYQDSWTFELGEESIRTEEAGAITGIQLLL